MRSAASRPPSNWPSSSLTAMRSAWNARVAGWVASPGRAGATRAIISRQLQGRDVGRVMRSATMARAMRRDARSSPKEKRMSAIVASSSSRRMSAALRPAAFHAHVERRVAAQREAALGLIELHRRDADVERDAVDRVETRAAGDRVEIGEAALDQASVGRRTRRPAPPRRRSPSGSRSIAMTRAPRSSSARV